MAADLLASGQVSAPESAQVLSITFVGPIVRVWHARPSHDLAETRDFLASIDEALSSRSYELLLLDSRDAERPRPEIQEAIWVWLSGHERVRKVAILMHSREHGRNVRLHGADQGVLLRTFDDEAQAIAWLRSR